MIKLQDKYIYIIKEGKHFFEILKICVLDVKSHPFIFCLFLYAW